uniref:Uncharacterized protein n=1 Tax=Arundo donax TaxID=35708 RepID=A0A0A9DRM7_ARUDO
MHHFTELIVPQPNKHHIHFCYQTFQAHQMIQGHNFSVPLFLCRRVYFNSSSIQSGHLSVQLKTFMQKPCHSSTQLLFGCSPQNIFFPESRYHSISITVEMEIQSSGTGTREG